MFCAVIDSVAQHGKFAVRHAFAYVFSMSKFVVIAGVVPYSWKGGSRRKREICKHKSRILYLKHVFIIYFKLLTCFA